MPDKLTDDFRTKEAYRRYLRRKKNLALFVLSLLVLLAMAVIVALALFGSKLIIGYRERKEGLIYRDAEPIPVTLVDNIFDGSGNITYHLPTISPVEPTSSDEASGYETEGASYESGTDSEASYVTDPLIIEQPEGEEPSFTPDSFEKGEHRMGLIIIDAGHGGYDGGTSNEYGTEKDLNLKLALMLKDRMQSMGYTVFMTRETDTYVGLYERANLANAKESPLALVSIHQNSVEGAESAAGVEAWTYDRAGCRELAASLSKHVAAATGAKNRGVGYRTNLVVTSKVTMPSAIIECGYMSNPAESYLLTTEEYREKIVCGIADGLINFIDSYY